MELGVIFLIWLAVTIIDNLAKRKRRIPPQNQSPEFDIPTLSNDPNIPGEEIPIFIESPTQAEVRPRNSSPRPKKIVEQRPQIEERNELNLPLTPSTVIDAFVMSEILGKPKALRKRF